MLSRFVLCKILQHGLTALGGRAPEWWRGRRRQGEMTLRQQEKKIPSVTTSVSVCVWWDGITPLNPEITIVINCLLFCLQKVNTV